VIKQPSLIQLQVFDLTVDKAKTECGDILPRVNGVPLGSSWKQNHGRGHGVLHTQLANGLGEREIYASWETLCIADEAQLLSFTVHNIGQDKVKETSGFTVSFKQRAQPEILRLSGEPADLEPHDTDLLDAWVAPPASLRLSILAFDPDRDIERVLDDQFRQLAELRAKALELQAAIHDKKYQIKHILEQDFRSTLNSCHGIKCVLKATFRKVPKIIQLIADRFHHGPPSPIESAEIRKQSDGAILFSSADLANETRSLDEDREEPSVDLLNVPQTPPPSHDELDGPLLPYGDMPPAPPACLPPPPPASGHPPPPSCLPPPPPPDHGRHHGHHGPPPPHFPPHHRHHAHIHKLLKHIIVIIVLSTLASLLFRHFRHNITLFRCCPRTAEHASRREERRNRRARRRAELQHNWSTWWNRYRRPASPADYDEKRTLILEQESVLEEAMQDEIRALRSAHQLVEEMYDAEEGRSRLYRAANRPGAPLASPVELDAAGGGNASGRRRSTSLSMYSVPPPLYDEELEGDLTVVDGFQYTPTSSTMDDDTPDSSVIDCSPRMSCDTGRTVVTSGEERD
jgi:hypothetical protein